MNRLARTEVRVACWLLALALAAGAMSLWDNQAAAQPNGADAAAAPANAADPNNNDATADDEAGPMNWSRSLGGMIIKSGWIGIPFYIFLGMLSILAMTVTLERLIRLNAGRVIPWRFVPALRQLIDRGEDNAEIYRELCDSFPSPITGILKAGLIRAGHPLLEVEKAMEDAAAREMSEMRSRHRPLNVVGNVAPLVGLLGTVVGMIFAFYQSSQAGLGKAEVLAEYIYLALITTALGLTIAIPALLFAAWFNARVERFMRMIDVYLLDTIPIFVQMERNAKAATTVDVVDRESYATVGD